MAIKFRYVDLLTGTNHVGAGAVSGEARGYINLGSDTGYGIVYGMEIKGDDANVNATNTIGLTDAEGRQVFAATAVDAGGTTSDEYTAQQSAIGTTVSAVSTVGVDFGLTYIETAFVDDNATRDISANTEGAVIGVFAKSPVLVTLASGSDGDWTRVGLWVEV
jgi:hypothetical protein